MVKPYKGGLVLTRIMKWTSLTVLLGALLFWSPAGTYAILLQFVICGSASLVAFQAARSSKHLWTIAFAGLAVLFNPVAPVPFSPGVFPWINLFCVTLFLASLRFLETPKLATLSIRYSGPQSQSL
jgi:hypothetical protein